MGGGTTNGRAPRQRWWGSGGWRIRLLLVASLLAVAFGGLYTVAGLVVAESQVEYCETDDHPGDCTDTAALTGFGIGLAIMGGVGILVGRHRALRRFDGSDTPPPDLHSDVTPES